MSSPEALKETPRRLCELLGEVHFPHRAWNTSEFFSEIFQLILEQKKTLGKETEQREGLSGFCFWPPERDLHLVKTRGTAKPLKDLKESQSQKWYLRLGLPLYADLRMSCISAAAKVEHQLPGT